MKTLILLFAGLIASSGWATPVIRADLRVGIMVSAQGWEQKKAKVRCGRVTKKKSPRSIAETELVAQPGPLTIPDNSGYTYDLGPARKLTVDQRTKTEGPTTKIAVKFMDAIRTTWPVHSNGKCTELYLDYRAERDSISGTISVGFTMPPNTWAIKVKRTSYAGLFTVTRSAGANMVNAFNGHLDKGLENNEMIIWAPPGTEIGQTFTFKSESTGDGAVGHFLMEFTKLDVGPPIKDMAQLNAFADGLTKVSDDAELKIAALAATIGDEAQLENLAANSSIDELHNTIQSLTRIMIRGDQSPTMWQIKAGSMILAHKLALILLKEVSPYCRIEDVNLPSTGKRAPVLALKLVSYLIGRAKARLTNQHFAHYKAFFTAIADFEAQGLTYAEIRNKPERFQKVKMAYQALRIDADLDISPIAGSLRDLKFLKDRFPSIGPADASMTEVVERLHQAHQNETRFNQEFLSYLRSFQKDNHAKVSTANLNSSLEKFEFMQLEALGVLDKYYHFVDLGSSIEVNTFIGLMVGVISHNVALFDTPVENFDAIRLYFSNNPETAKARAGVARCTGVE